MNISSIKPHVDASKIPIDQLAGTKSVSQEDKVKEVSRQFESVLVKQILTEARKSELSSDDQDSTATEIYNDMINNQVADCISRSGSFGLAKSLESQLVRQVLPKAESAPGAANPVKPQVKPTDK